MCHHLEKRIVFVSDACETKAEWTTIPNGAAASCGGAAGVGPGGRGLADGRAAGGHGGPGSRDAGLGPCPREFSDARPAAAHTEVRPATMCVVVPVDVVWQMDTQRADMEVRAPAMLVIFTGGPWSVVETRSGRANLAVDPTGPTLRSGPPGERVLHPGDGWWQRGTQRGSDGTLASRSAVRGAGSPVFEAGDEMQI
jgi:hypothetical protein